MKKREKILGLLFLGILLLFGGNKVFESLIEGPIKERRQKLARLEKSILASEEKRDAAFEAGKELVIWQQKSLPSDIDVARSLYQAWLLELLTERIGLEENIKAVSGEAVNRKGLYISLPFSVRGQGTLQQLVEFLYQFYSVDLLHQIQTLKITPLTKQGQFDLAISIEALVLPGANQQQQLNLNRSDRLAFSTLEDYLSITQRNIFGLGGGSPAAADFAFLTGITKIDGEPHAWITLRSSDEILKLRKGESFKIGQVNGTIAEIEEEDVIIEADDERWLITVGENLASASALPPEF